MTAHRSVASSADVNERLHILLLQEPAYLCPHDYMKEEREIHLRLESSPSTHHSLNKVLSDASIGDVTRSLDSPTTTTTSNHPSQRRLLPSSLSMQFWREQMFDWAIMVTDSFGADRDVVAVSFNLLDRYLVHELRPRPPLTAPLPITRDDYQLFCMTCLYLAIKVLEPYPRKLTVQTLVDMSKQYYSHQVIEQTERDILGALQWRLHAPTAGAFGRLYAEMLLLNNETAPPAMFEATLQTLTELSVADGRFVTDRPSHVGRAAVLLAAQQMGMNHTVVGDRLGDNMSDPTFVTVLHKLRRMYWD